MPSTSAPSDNELLETFLRHLRVERGVSPRTLISYKTDLKVFLASICEQNKDPLSVSHDDLTDYLWGRKSKGIQPSEANYVCQDRNGVRTLQFTRSGDPALETLYRTHYVAFPSGNAALTSRATNLKANGGSGALQQVARALRTPRHPRRTLSGRSG